MAKTPDPTATLRGELERRIERARRAIAEAKNKYDRRIAQTDCAWSEHRLARLGGEASS